MPFGTLQKGNIAAYQIVSGDLCAGNVFHQPVRIMVDETFPSVSELPGKS
jgi:hypothetical protein